MLELSRDVVESAILAKSRPGLLKPEFDARLPALVTERENPLVVAYSGVVAVSYTHLDVYKRQVLDNLFGNALFEKCGFHTYETNFSLSRSKNSSPADEKT